MLAISQGNLLTDIVIPFGTLIVLAIGALNLPAVRESRKRKRQAEDVILGVTEGPGIESRPSLVARMHTVELASAAVAQSVEDIKKSVLLNGGDSKGLGDTVHRLETALTGHIDHEESILQKLHDQLEAHTANDSHEFEALRSGQEEIQKQILALMVVEDDPPDDEE